MNRLLPLLLGLALPAAAAVPGTLPFEGRLIDPATLDPRSEASVSVVFRVYDDPTAGTQLWAEGPTSVALDDGHFETTLGAAVPLSSSVFASDGRWLEVSVEGVALTPRQRLPSAPWALRAAAADSLEPGAANYLNNRTDLQAGASFHASSASVSGPLTTTGTQWAVADLSVRGVVRTGTGLHQITTAGGLLDAAKADPATVVPDASLDSSSVTKLGPAADVPGGLAVLDGSGYLPAGRYAGNVTRKGNTFNGASQLAKLTAAALLPNALVDVSSVAKLLAGRLPSALLDMSSVTKVGNGFNAADTLVLLGAGNLVPNAQVDGSSVAKLSPAGRVHNTQLDASTVTLAANGFNGAGQLVLFDASATLNAAAAGSAVYSVVTSSSVDVAGTGAKVREAGVDLVPAGLTIFWTGLSCPSGYAEETNLRGRLPLGACAACNTTSTSGAAFTTDAQALTHTHADTGGGASGMREGGTNLLTDSADTTMPYIQVLFCRKT
ncbi:hypothetical protein EPO15_01545 [bacterium]|nr:MAG: hypothetical protein EPO15_01545 [bacterium]